MKYSNEFKMKCIEMYYRGEYPETPEGIKLIVFHKQIREWVRISERSSLDSVLHMTNSKQKTAEEKLEYVQQVLAGKANRIVAEENKMDTSCCLQTDVHVELFNYCFFVQDSGYILSGSASLYI